MRDVTFSTINDSSSGPQSITLDVSEVSVKLQVVSVMSKGNSNPDTNPRDLGMVYLNLVDSVATGPTEILGTPGEY